MSATDLLKKILTIVPVLLMSYMAVGQCDRVGIVERPFEECDIYFFDFETEKYLQIVSGNNLPLHDEDIISFSFTLAGASYECSGLTVYPVDITCISAVTTSQAENIMCDYIECIYPGDANLDSKANVTDLLNIGFGYGTEGPARPSASEDWEAQTSQDWAQNTPTGINYKHLDSNGDGLINEIDKNAIGYNYLPEPTFNTTTYDSDVAELSINFNIDTLTIDEDSPNAFFVEATIDLGSADAPVEDIHGLSFMLEYGQDLLPPHAISYDYNSESFFGEDSDVLWIDHELYQLGRNDIALTRKSGSTTNGYGTIFTTSFVIIVDIIDGRAEEITPFTVRLRSVEVIDSEGSPIPVNEGEAATFFIHDKRTVSSNRSIKSKKSPIKLSPNPANTFINIDTENTELQEVNIYDACGNLILSNTISGSNDILNISSLNEGLYIVHIRTNEGIQTRKIMIQR